MEGEEREQEGERASTHLCTCILIHRTQMHTSEYFDKRCLCTFVYHYLRIHFFELYFVSPNSCLNALFLKPNGSYSSVHWSWTWTSLELDFKRILILLLQKSDWR